ncbi:MAG: nucleotide exchange factor GrpE [Candidatus Shapirobacteria bacterium]|jgi:molecular chaperone GrpE (heat shock protein)
MANLKLQNQELTEKLKRSLADYANLEKRIESQRQLFVTLTATAIISKMIDILDDLYLAFDHLKDPGLKIAIDKFATVLVSEGLTEIKAINEPFNAENMECIATASGPENEVIKVNKRGYLLNGHCLRPAQVVVGKKPTTPITNDQITSTPNNTQ